jgi:hypothetical protein
VQFARALTGLIIIATASRPEMGAHHVINHHRGLAKQVATLGVGSPAFVFSTTQTASHLSEIVWLRYQPGSALSIWFLERVGDLKGRVPRIAIVALARKLLVALWRYLETGLVPTGAVFKAR